MERETEPNSYCAITKKHGPYKTTTFRRTQVDLKTYTHVDPRIYSTQKSTVLSKIKSDDLKVVKWKNQL